MSFKINFHVSGATAMANETVFNRIAAVLENKRYRVLSTTLDTVTFDCNPWRLKWSFEPTQVSGGLFEVHHSVDGQTVSLKYYINLLYPVIVVVVFFITLLNDKLYDALWFFGAFYAITMSIAIITVRSKGRKLLRDVLTEGIS